MNPSESRDRGQQAVNIAEIFLQQSARLLETQAAAARAVMRTQARALAAVGGPDWSSLYTPENERQFSEFLKTSTDQAVSFMRHTSDTVRQFQDVLAQLANQQTNQLTAQLRTTAEELGQRAQEVQRQAREAADQTRQQARNVAEQSLQGSNEEQRARSKRPA
jgi:hypothetical protein